MTNYISLSYWDIGLSLLFVVAAIIVSLSMRLGLAKDLTIAGIRTLLQLGLAGLVLGAVFRWSSPVLVFTLIGVMILIAGREGAARQKIKVPYAWVDMLGAMAVAAFVVGITVTFFIIDADPWYKPAVAVPLFGMLIGNSLNGVSLAMDRFLSDCYTKRLLIETQLALGATVYEATHDIVKGAIKTGMIPIINSMMIVGLVSLPGMMTGQLLAGADPMDAVLYQVVIMYMITASASFGSFLVVLFARKRLFTSYHSLRPDLVRIDK